MASVSRRAILAGLASTGFTALAARAQNTPAGEWPQWRGPDRNGISRETGLLKTWPAGGPTLVWKTEGLGGGYGTPSVSGGRIFGMGYRGDREVAWARDARSGTEVWGVEINRANREVGYADGSRTTPTIHGGRYYAVGVSGDVVCLDAGTGAVVWRKNFVNDFGGQVPRWGFAESPLIDGQKVIVTPGGPGAAMVALDRSNGNVIWKAEVPGGDRAHYSSAVIADLNGVRQYIQFMSGGVVSISADGKFLWRYDRPANRTANISTVIHRDGVVFAASSYDTGGGQVRVTGGPNGFTATETYFTREMKNHHGGMILIGDHLYGFNDPRNLTCQDWKTGQVKWEDRSVGKSSLVYADGHLYVRSERGPVALVEATPTAYVEKGRFDQPDRSSKAAWSHPVVAGGRLYLRDQDILLCYDVKAP